MGLVLVFLGLIFILGVMVGYILCIRNCTKHLREQNDLLAQQNKTISDLQQRDDPSNYWKPEGWKADQEQGDA